MSTTEYRDTYLGADLGVIDPDIDAIIEHEAERQARKLIMIPSESIAPLAVRQALGSVFNNVYAEGYPPLRMTRDEEEMLLDIAHQLVAYRRYADRRFYKGVDFVNFIETLAQRRAADCLANDRVASPEIYVNVQPLSGAAANLAVYDTLLDVGDTVMGMDLYQGGHLTHGSEFNFSGKRYHVASYGVSRETSRLDYDAIRELAQRARPKMIIAGFTSYTWVPDWELFAEIAHEVGAKLLADISHPAGMAIAGAYPSPVGIADVITFTTHKTLCGPRGAVIVSTDEELAHRVDMAVFPGEQGGPHTQKFAAMAVAFKIAQTETFRRMMFQIVENARALADGLVNRGLKLAYGGTDTHFCVLDLNSVGDHKGSPLRGEPAVRILDLAGIVANKNTIPGDTQTALAMGIRLGSPWLTQRGFGPAEMDAVAGLIHRVVTNIRPFSYTGLSGELPRGKIDASVLAEVRAYVDRETGKQGDKEMGKHGDTEGTAKREEISSLGVLGDLRVLVVKGERAEPALNQIVTCDVAALTAGMQARGFILDPDGVMMSEVRVTRLEPDAYGRDRFVLRVPPENGDRVAGWLRDLADGYVLFDREELLRKVEGPFTVEEWSREEIAPDIAATLRADVRTPDDVAATPGATGLALYQGGAASRFELRKPYFVGHQTLDAVREHPELPVFFYESPADAPLRRTPLYDWHRAHTSHIVPFAGWEMPVWYTGVLDEHNAVRKAAGLFDVAHMGVFECRGPHAVEFLDLVCTNYVRWYAPGESFYSYLLDADGKVIDDLLVYRRAADRFLIVVNAANAEKDWAWLNAVNAGRVLLDPARPDLRVLRPAELRDLKGPAAGSEMRVDLALQGPAALRTLQALTDDPRLRDRLARVRKTGLIECDLGSFDLVIARTGYTGEDVGYEIFVHPDRAVALWEALLEAGQPFGVQPAGLAARDSTRTEAGLPLYGHELAGPFDISPAGARFAGYVKLHKPYFIGRPAYLAAEQARTMEVARFRMKARGVRMPKTGDPVVNARGQAVGWVTSAAVDVNGVILGLAYVQSRYARPGDEIGVFNLPAKPLTEKGNKAELEPGDKVALADWAVLLPRFPDAVERAGWRDSGWRMADSI